VPGPVEQPTGSEGDEDGELESEGCRDGGRPEWLFWASLNDRCAQGDAKDNPTRAIPACKIACPSAWPIARPSRTVLPVMFATNT
jgi:hypothetical protein